MFAKNDKVHKYLGIVFRFCHKSFWGKLFGGTVPPNNTLFGGTVPPNSTLFGGTPDFEKPYLISILC